MTPDNSPGPVAALLARYDAVCRTPSDINEHCHVLRALASECERVTEMGTRTGRSTTALAAAFPAALTCYDLSISPKAAALRSAVLAAGRTRMELVKGNTLEVDIDRTDMLFIDTLHTRAQLAAELSRHAGRVSKIIAMHDTTSFGSRDEKTGAPGGLVAAIDGFLASEEGARWRVAERYPNNNGLTVLRRIGS